MSEKKETIITFVMPLMKDGSDDDEEYTPPKKKQKVTKKPIKPKTSKLNFTLRDPKPVHSLSDLISQLKKYVETLRKRRVNKRKKTFHEKQIKDVQNIIDPLKDLDNLIGLKNVKTQIVNQLLLYLQGLEDKNMFLHTVITGNPGTGKTTLCGILARIYKNMGILETDKVTNVDRSQLVGQWLGETSQKTKKVLLSAIGGVLLIDEAYALGNKEGRDSFSKECLDCINQFLSERAGEFVCIIAGYKTELDDCFFSRNPGLRRRFPWTFHIPDYTPKDLFQIFTLQLKSQKWKTTIKEEECIKMFEQHKHLFPSNGGDTQNILDKAKVCHARRVFGRSKKEKRILTTEDLQRALTQHQIKKKDFPFSLYL